MKLDDIPTPALVIDAQITRRNIDRLAHYAASHKLGVRPHTKTHKNRMLAEMQLAAGAVGLTAAKVGEAEQMAEVGDDILLAYPAIDPGRTARVARLAREKTVRVAIDSATAVEILASAAKGAGATIGLLVDIDVGMGRTGVATPEDALKLAQLISNTPGVRLDGIMCYPGQVWAPADKQGEALTPIAAKLQQTIDLWRKSGLEAKIVSGGSTPTAYQSHLVPQLTEMRPGTYIFNDMNCVRGNYATLDDCAARIVVTVVSDAVPNQIVIDAGTKTLTSDRCHPDPDSGHGYIVEYPNTKIKKLSEEHGQVDVSASVKAPKIGERVTVIPNHICPCVNLQDNLWWLERDGEVRQLRVDARGKLS
jgi:D-serine deaminase-like pyridoxal phosphate-dependent protein